MGYLMKEVEALSEKDITEALKKVLSDMALELEDVVTKVSNLES